MKTFLYCMVIALLCSCNDRSNKQQDNKPSPNFLIIVADDMGYSDFAPFGGEISTPNLSALANSGLTLTNYYTAPTCSPARAMLFSGNDNHVAGIGNMAEFLPFTTNLEGKPGYEGYLNNSIVPFPMLLKENGYHTYAAGKWHLGHEEEHTPFHKGFEETFVLLDGMASHWDDQKVGEPAGKVRYSSNGKRVNPPKGFYSTKGYTDKIIEFIDKNKSDEKPFFAYLAYTAPHDPLHVPDDWIDKYKGKYDGGYDQLRTERFLKMQELGILDKNMTLPEGMKSVKRWNQLTEEEKTVESKRMEIYAAMVEYIDMQVGRLIDKLKEDNLYDNTLIVFISDNGANPQYMKEYPSSSEEWMQNYFDNSFENLGKRGSGVATGPGWAQASMSPFRFFKTYVAEGGIKAPFIASGYGVKKSEPNNSALTHVMDLAPTILELANIQYPEKYQGKEVRPILGKSMAPLLNGSTNNIRTDQDFLGWELFGHTALRKGDWKIVKIIRSPDFQGNDWKLYHLKTDPSETINLADQHPEKMEELMDAWAIYRQQNNVIIPQYKKLESKH